MSGPRRFFAYFGVLSSGCSGTLVFLRLALHDQGAAAAAGLAMGVLGVCVILVIELQETVRVRMKHPESVIAGALAGAIAKGTSGPDKAPAEATAVRTDARKLLKEAGQNPLLGNIVNRDDQAAPNRAAAPVSDLTRKRSG